MGKLSNGQVQVMELKSTRARGHWGLIKKNAFRGLLVLAITTLSLPSICAQDFKIVSQIYGARDSAPIAQNLTLFSNGLAFDFQMEGTEIKPGSEIVIYDSRQRTLVLLNPSRKTRLDLSDIRLLKIVDGVRKETELDNRTSFLVNDDYREELDLAAGRVTVASPNITYRAQGTQPKEVGNMPLYFQFLDSLTNSMATDPGKVPPFARIRLNRAIKRLGWFPSEVQFTAEQNSLFKEPLSMKSKHQMFDGLSDLDRARIKQAKSDWGQFKLVDLAEFRGLPDQPRLSRLKKPAKNALETPER